MLVISLPGMGERFPTPGPQIPGWGGGCYDGGVYHLWGGFKSVTPYACQALLILFIYIRGCH